MKIRNLLLGAGALGAAAEYGLASYFFNRILVRKNASTDRTIRMAGTNWETYMPKIQEWKAWMNEQPQENVYIHGWDGIKLHGTYFPGEGGSKIVICFHGYTSEGLKDYIGLSNYYLRRGYQMLMVDNRAHGKSGGKYIGFGCLDRKDGVKWVQYVVDRLGKDCEIYLHGNSMGAATVLMMSGLKLPDNVKAMVSDCAFTSAWEVFTHVLKKTYHLPAFPLMEITDKMTRKRAGYGLDECNGKRELPKAKVPILFIHGETDDFVPSSMCYELYEKCPTTKDMLIVPGAGHAESFYKATKEYEDKLTAFLK